MSVIAASNREQVMNQNDFIVSKTDLKGNITYCNEIFMKMAKMSEKDLLGKPHNIVRHPEMPKAVFKLLWDYVKSGKEIFAYVKNIAKDGSFYWVYANITPSYDHNRNIIGYYSIRMKPNPKALEVIKPLYEQMLSLERSGGVQASIDYLNNILNEKGATYDEFIIAQQSK